MVATGAGARALRIAPPGFDPRDVAPRTLRDGPWRVTSLALDVSGNCNLACRYCAEAATMPRRQPMTPDLLDAALALLRAGGPLGPGASLRFGSGEPLLALPLLHRVVELLGDGQGGGGGYGGRNGDGNGDGNGNGGGARRPLLFLTTNGTLLDDATASWLFASGFYVKVSLDGPQPTHDAWRQRPGGDGTWGAVTEAVARLVRLMPDRVSVTAVLCRGADPDRVFAAAAALGVKRIELVPVAYRDAAVRPASADIGRYQAFVLDYARRYAAAGDGEAPPILIRFAARVARAMGYGNVAIPCGAGRSFLGAGADGGLYPCFRFIGLEEYRLGDVAAGPDPARTNAFQRGPGRPYQGRGPCRACWGAPLCGGPCYACAEMFGPGDGRPVAAHCEYTLADARAAVWLVNRLRRRDPRRLLTFIPGVADAGLIDAALLE